MRKLLREPLLHLKNASDLHGVSASTISCQACFLRPSCHSTLTLNQGDLVLEPDMDYCSTSPEPFFATIQLVPSLAKVFQHVPHSNHVFNWGCVVLLRRLRWGWAWVGASPDWRVREVLSMTSRNHGFDLTEDGMDGLLGRLRERSGDSADDVRGSGVCVPERKEIVVFRVPGGPWL